MCAVTRVQHVATSFLWSLTFVYISNQVGGCHVMIPLMMCLIDAVGGLQLSAVSPQSFTDDEAVCLESSCVQLNLVRTGLFLLDAVQSRWIQICTDVFHLQASPRLCFKPFQVSRVLRFNLTKISWRYNQQVAFMSLHNIQKSL